MFVPKLPGFGLCSGEQIWRDLFPNFKLKNEIKGPDNPTCQLLPTSSKRKVKMAWEMQEREKRWSRIGVRNKEPVCEEVVR